MKKTLLVSIAIAFALSLSPGCKSIAKSVAKRWAKKKQKEFLQKCNSMVANKPGIQAGDFCTCALDLVMEAYPDPEKGMQISVLELLNVGKDCIGKK